MIFRLFQSEEFILTLPTYAGAVEAMKKLVSYATKHKLQIVLHTHVYDGVVAGAREKWCRSNFSEQIAKGEIKLDITTTNKKQMLNSLIVFEDNCTNITNSIALTKFLIEQPHKAECKGGKDVNRCKSFMEAVTLLIGSDGLWN